jgi:hypothetical protein
MQLHPGSHQRIDRTDPVAAGQVRLRLSYEGVVFVDTHSLRAFLRALDEEMIDSDCDNADQDQGRDS